MLGKMKMLTDKFDGLRLLPVAGTLMLAIWTASVYRFSKYGDNWAFLPAMLMLPSILLAHVVLIVRRKPRLPYIIYAVIHATIFIPLWFGSLMLISKDSL